MDYLQFEPRFCFCCEVVQSSLHFAGGAHGLRSYWVKIAKDAIAPEIKLGHYETQRNLPFGYQT
jgi:hypothetical protein